MKTSLSAICVVAVLALLPGFAAASPSAFQAFLTGAGENPSVPSTATGYGTVLLSPDQTHITVNLSWTGLTVPATASHIHGPALTGDYAGIIFPFSGVPSATAGSIPEQVFSITPTQVGYLETGQLYFDVHNSNYPGGEIRGQIEAVPEPATLALLAIGGLAMLRRRSRREAR